MPIDPKWEPPRLMERQRSRWWQWALVLILIIGLVIFFPRQSAPVTSQQETTAAPTQETTTPIESKTAFKSEAPSFDSHCTVVAGVVPGSIKTVDSTVTFTFKNNGKVTIEGSYFEASNEAVKAYRQNSDKLEPGKEVSYSIDLNSVSNEVGVQVKKFVVLPVQNSKACENQRMLVVQ
jgi:hypothetical protein